ncbi:hypothetical protein BDF19DRAFT_450165 [Syncephalis fuscata]|nr:hypothetical protein BDF19DRAFT_450165 [Syncephalis fuscata]
MTIEFEGWLEQWLVNLSHTVAQIANIDNDDSDDHSMEIPPSLEQLENIVEDVEQRMINETWSCVQIEEETLNLMLERVADPQSTEVLTAFSDYFSGVADNIKRKLNVQKAQVLRQIYSGHAPDALRCIRDKLLMQQAEIQKAFSEDNAKLHEYQSAGVEYVQIANEHGELLDAIKEVEEDINRIKIV